MNGISAFVKGLQSVPSPLPPREDTRQPSMNQTRNLPDTEPAGTLILDFPDSKTVRNKCPLLRSHSVYDILHSRLTALRQSGLTNR